MESTCVYWIPCPSVCRRRILLHSLTDVDKFYVATSFPFDGTGRHVIRQVLVVASYNGTSVRLLFPITAADHEPRDVAIPGSHEVRLEAFQSIAVGSRALDLTGLSVEANRPVFVAVSISSKTHISATSTVQPVEADDVPAKSTSSVQSQQTLNSDQSPAARETSNQYRTSPAPDVGTSSASYHTMISGRSDAGETRTVVEQMGSVGRLALTYVLMFAGDRRHFYRIAGAWSN